MDAVTEVSRISSSSIEPPSNVITANDSEYLRGIVKTYKKLIILLDTAKVISDADVEALGDVQQSSDSSDAIGRLVSQASTDNKQRRVLRPDVFCC